MQEEDLSFPSDFGLVYATLYLPSQSNGVIIQIAHGMIEERSKYQEFARFLAQNGYIVAVNDHRGHGESIGGKSGKYEVQWGEMGENGFEKAVGDLLSLTQILKKRFAPKHFVLLGHSMGSLLARRYLQLHENELDALILLGSPSPNVFAGFGVNLCRFLQFFGLNRLGYKVMNFLTLVSFNAEFKRRDCKNPSYAWLSRDLKAVEPYKQRGDYNFSFTLESFKGLFGGVKQVFSPYPNVKNTKLPILLMSGEEDPCGEFGKGVFKAYKHILSQGYEDVQMRLYGKARHELLLEHNQQEVMQEIKQWCEEKI